MMTTENISTSRTGFLAQYCAEQERRRYNLGAPVPAGRHASLAVALAWPEWLVRLEFRVFEELLIETARKWAVRLVEAVPERADVSPAQARILTRAMREIVLPIAGDAAPIVERVALGIETGWAGGSDAEAREAARAEATARAACERIKEAEAEQAARAARGLAHARWSEEEARTEEQFAAGEVERVAWISADDAWKSARSAADRREARAASMEAVEAGDAWALAARRMEKAEAETIKADITVRRADEQAAAAARRAKAWESVSEGDWVWAWLLAWMCEARILAWYALSEIVLEEVARCA